MGELLHSLSKCNTWICQSLHRHNVTHTIVFTCTEICCVASRSHTANGWVCLNINFFTDGIIFYLSICITAVLAIGARFAFHMQCEWNIIFVSYLVAIYIWTNLSGSHSILSHGQFHDCRVYIPNETTTGFDTFMVLVFIYSNSHFFFVILI